MNDWREVTLAEVASEVTVGHVGSMAKYYVEEGIPFLRSLNVHPHSISLRDVKYISPEFHAKLGKSALLPGDVVTVRTGKPGTTSVIPEDLPVANCSDLVITRPGPDLDSRWFSYYMNSTAAHFIDSQLVGAVQQHFNVGSARSMKINLPPLHYQEAVVAVLGVLDDKIAVNTRQAHLAEELAGTLFDQAAALLPKQPMSNLLTPILGGTPPRSNPTFWGGAGLWASAKDVTEAPFSVVMDTEEKITPLALEKTKAKPLPEGSVILTARGTVGAVARLATPASFNQSCYGFLPDSLSPSLLYFSVLRATDQAKALVHGSVFDTITKRTFDHLLIPQFGDAESSLESKLSPLLDLVTACVHENRTLAATRDALLPQLMSGKLKVRDAEKVVENAL